MGSYGSTTNAVRWIFVICNIVFLALGATSFGIGVWGVVEGREYDVVTGDDTLSAAVLLLVGGFITMIVAFVGIVGAIGMWRPLLLIYSLAVVVIIILEFVAAILAFVFVDNITDVIEENMEDAIRDYRLNDTSSDVNDAVETVQDNFECCGINNASDWIRLNPDAVEGNEGIPPANCICDLNEDDCVQFQDGSIGVWEEGCLEKLEDNLRPVGIAVGVIGIIFAVIEALLVLMALCLCCCIYSARHKTTV